MASSKRGSISEEIWENLWNDTASKTIEHIHPQDTWAAGWEGKFRVSQDQLRTEVHRLGNLAILPLNVNSSIGNMPFSEKKKVYERNRGLHMFDWILNQAD